MRYTQLEHVIAELLSAKRYNDAELLIDEVESLMGRARVIVTVFHAAARAGAQWFALRRYA